MSGFRIRLCSLGGQEPGLFVLTAVSLVPGIKWALDNYLFNKGANEMQQVGNKPIAREYS